MAYILIGIIIFLAGAIQGLTGFGSALVAMSLLPFVINLEQAVPFVAVNAMIIGLINFHSVRSHFVPKEFFRLLVGAILGTPLGILVLVHVDVNITKRILGLMIVLYSIYSLAGMSPEKMNLKESWGYITGIVSGILGGAFTVNGPPVIIYLSMKYVDKHKIKSVLAGYFLASGIVIIFMFYLNGLFTATVNKYCLFLFPATIIGVLTGNYFYKKADQKIFRKLVYCLLLISGILLIIK